MNKKKRKNKKKCRTSFKQLMLWILFGAVVVYVTFVAFIQVPTSAFDFEIKAIFSPDDICGEIVFPEGSNRTTALGLHFVSPISKYRCAAFEEEKIEKKLLMRQKIE